MALQKSMSNVTYLSIRDGKIAKKVGEEYEFYSSVSGHLMGLSTKEGKYGDELLVDLKDGDENYRLQIRIKGNDAGKQSSYFISFAHCAPNIDPSKELTLIPSLKIVDERKRAALFLEQGGEIMKWAYKKGEGMPEPEEVFNKKGELISTDWSEVESFRLDKVNELNSRINKSANALEASSVKQEVQADDDLPF